tara:strand:- start:4412 stop:5983 length:1572 start_codon:yes stop_codon:yes gene_type:complete
MRYREKIDLLSFLDVSIVMPFYKRLDDFKKTLPKNSLYFERNGVEVVIVLDEPREEDGLLEFIEKYPFIDFKIIINRTSHEWRNPCKVLNVGIRNSNYNYILILDPEVELITDVVYQLRYVLEYYQSSYATGVVSFIDYDEKIDNLTNYSWLPYGSIMMPKETLKELGGYNENFLNWGGEDNQIRRKLDLKGINQVELLDAMTVHREKVTDGHYQRSLRVDKMPVRLLKKILYPKRIRINDENWGTEFNEVIWNWSIDKSYGEFKKYMSQFKENHILDKARFKENHNLIILIQTRNESSNIVPLLDHLNQHCSGILLLDDDSKDGTYEMASHSLILAKAKKSHKGYFDDLENRNILLKMANFVKSKWFIFIDADERFDPRYCNLKHYINLDHIDSYYFYLVDLWDMPDTYRGDIPYSQNGIIKRARMFKNKGSSQIICYREIHFAAIPFYKNLQTAQILILHYGNYNKKIRERKFKLYTAQDPDGKKIGEPSYNFLKDEKVKLLALKKLDLERFHNSEIKSIY